MWRAQCGASIFKQQQMRLLRGQCMFRRKAHVMLPLASNFCTTTASSHHPTIRGGGVPSSPRRHLASSLLFRSIHSSPSSSSSSSRPPPSSPSSLESTAPSSAPLQADTETETDKISSTPQEIFRVDYRPPSFSIEHVHLSFMLDLDDTVVTTRSSISRSSSSADSTGHQPLVLDGEELELLSVSINDQLLQPTDYTVTPAALIIAPGVLSRFPASFELSTSVRLCPRLNLALSGLYASSGDLLCTQCEAMGFRRITYHLDRPDVLSRYRVYMEGCKASFPALLSNGNLVSSGDLPSDGSRHFAQWDDPFPKPAYLFGLVAGPLVSLQDTFTTRTGKEVQLGIFSKGSPSSSPLSPAAAAAPLPVDKFRHAMSSLQQAMRWDEEVFGLECDLDTYNVVAVDDFNMGAMENKGLNIFNSAYVLADPATATDDDYGRVLTVIGHEYFHNWTGNRITLRDWFQLTLKEGLTVFRDQWFTSDLLHGHGLQRIQDVNTLRSAQFLEDSGPTAHPIRPESYMAMDNFYTSTVYLKGAEVVRMYRSLLGEQGFLRGVALYVSRHDGQAVTCDDFLAAMRDANPETSSSLDNFERWYEQPGTPLLTVEHTALDTNTSTLAITFSQKNVDLHSSPSSQEQEQRQGQGQGSPLLLLPPLPIPIQTAVYDRDTGALLQSSLLVLNHHEQTFHFHNISAAAVVVSPLQSFSAPVRLAFPQQSEADLQFLLQHDTDAFNKWECRQRVSSRVILGVAGLGDSAAIGKAELPPYFVESFKQTLLSIKDTPPAELGTVAALLALPSFSSLLLLQQQSEDTSHSTKDTDRDKDTLELLHQARTRVVHLLSVAAEQQLMEAYEALRPESTVYQFTNEEVSRRSLRNECLRFITARQYEGGEQEQQEEAKLRVNLASDQYYLSAGACMTDAEAALSSLLAINHAYAKPFQENALDHFFYSAEDDPLVVNKWLKLQAAVDSEEVFSSVVSLKTHPSFSMSNPNAVRALVGAFAANSVHFHHPSGRGYFFLADCVLELDRHNPQMAAKLTLPLSQWRRQDPSRQRLMRAALQRIAAAAAAASGGGEDKGGGDQQPPLSADTYEIVHRSLQA